jgi:hypothetical protein
LNQISLPKKKENLAERLKIIKKRRNNEPFSGLLFIVDHGKMRNARVPLRITF